MKHDLRITVVLVTIFFISQLMGLLIVNSYIDHKISKKQGEVIFKDLPYDIERPPVEQKSSFIFIFTGILIGTLLLLLLIKFKKKILWKAWFFMAVMLCLAIAFSAFIPSTIALIFSFTLAYFKVFKPTVWIHDLTEIFIYGGLAAIFVPIMNLFAVFMLLLLISIYDMIAVWKSKHMIKLAKFSTSSKTFPGLLIPYKEVKIKKPAVKVRVKNAILGGGDIGFPLLFAGVVMKDVMLNNSVIIGFLKVLVIPIFSTMALFLLFIKGKKDRFYPAMPFLSMGCVMGYGLMYIFGFV